MVDDDEGVLTECNDVVRCSAQVNLLQAAVDAGKRGLRFFADPRAIVAGPALDRGSECCLGVFQG